MSTSPTRINQVTIMQVMKSPEQQHESMLGNVFHFSQLQDQGASPGVTVLQCLKCKEAIAEGVLVQGGALAAFLRNRGWYDVEPIRELFAAYVQAGYIQLNLVTPLVALPLEVAVISEHLEVLQACLANGADERLVPSSEAVRSRPEFPDDDEPEDGPKVLIHDVYDLVDNEVAEPGTAPAMKAVLRVAAMQRRIRELRAPEGGSIDVGPEDPNTGSNTRPAAPRSRRAQL